MIAQRGWVVKGKRRYGEGSAGRLTQGQRWKGLFPRLSSPVNSRRGSNGAEPLGREEGSRGTFMEWFPGRVFAFFRRAAKEGRSRRSETSLVLFPSFVPAAADNTPVPVIAKPRKGLWQSVTPSILPSPPQRAILQVSADSQLASAIRFPVPSPPAGNFLCSPADLQCKCNKNKKAVTQRGITLKMVVARQPKKEGDLNEPLPSS